MKSMCMGCGNTVDTSKTYICSLCGNSISFQRMYKLGFICLAFLILYATWVSYYG